MVGPMRRQQIGNIRAYPSAARPTKQINSLTRPFSSSLTTPLIRQSSSSSIHNMIDLTSDDNEVQIIQSDSDDDEYEDYEMDECHADSHSFPPPLSPSTPKSQPHRIPSEMERSNTDSGSTVIDGDIVQEDEDTASDDDFIMLSNDNHRLPLPQSTDLHILAHAVEVINLDDDYEMLGENEDEDQDEDEIVIIDVHSHRPNADEILAGVMHSQYSTAQSEAAIGSIRTVEKYKPNPSTTCARGRAVQFQDGSFMLIELVYEVRGEVFVAGKHLLRQNFLKPFMPLHRNELVWIITAQGDQNAFSKTATRSAGDVNRNRVIIFTNQSFPKASSNTDAESFRDRKYDVAHGPLFCRWKRTVIAINKRVQEERFERLYSSEVDHTVRRDKKDRKYNTYATDSELGIEWRSVRSIPGGTHRAGLRDEDDHHIVLDADFEHRHRAVRRAYTFADAFCGCGGTSMGAVNAGLQPTWAFDMDSQAADTYRLNFYEHDASVFCKAVHEFVGSKACKYADIIHISPPCQPFSPAHTVPSPERDEMNQAAIFSIYHIIDQTKPRVATVEQTFGLQQRHREYFAAVINIFLSLNYSVVWRVIKCADYGVPQTRSRLVIIAAAPGEKLPKFPEPTHGIGAGRKRLVTIDDAIERLPRDVCDHDTTVRFRDGRKAPFRGNIQAKTLTCSGGVGNYHPSGLRPYTVREIASLQTFPHDFSFDGATTLTAKKRQIGNAVPPILAKAIFQAIIKSLKDSDGIRD